MKRAFAIVLVMVVCLFPRTRANGQRSGLTPAPRQPHPPIKSTARTPAMPVMLPVTLAMRISLLPITRRRTIGHPWRPGHDSILGSFTSGDNILKAANPNLFFRREEQRVDGKSDGFFQTAVAGTPPHSNACSERIAVVVGSGDGGL